MLQQERSSLLLKGPIENVPPLEIERSFFSRYFLVPKKDGALCPTLDLHRLNFSLYRGNFKMLMLKTIVTDLSGRLVCHRQTERYLFSYSGHAVSQEVTQVSLWGKSLPAQSSSLWSSLGTKDIHKVHGCCSGPIEALEHLYTQLPG